MVQEQQAPVRRTMARRVIPYDGWIDSQGIPIYGGYSIYDPMTLELAPWDLWGLKTAFLQLEGMPTICEGRVSEIDHRCDVYALGVILIVAALVVTARGAWEPLNRVSRFGAAMLVLSGVATGLSWLCYYRALQLGPASRVAPVDKLSVVVAMVLAALVLGEPITWKHWVGGVLIVLGTLVLAWE